MFTPIEVFFLVTWSIFIGLSSYKLGWYTGARVQLRDQIVFLQQFQIDQEAEHQRQLLCHQRHQLN